MADAKCCDACGKFYNLYNHKDNDDGFNTIILISFNDSCSWIKRDKKELCPECMNSVEEHIEKLRTLSEI